MIDSGPYMDILWEIDHLSINVSEWEAGFIESIMKRSPATLTEKQINVINRMRAKYLAPDYAPKVYDDELDDIPF